MTIFIAKFPGTRVSIFFFSFEKWIFFVNILYKTTRADGSSRATPDVNVLNKNCCRKKKC
jgi:hypothetical protein